MTTRRPNAFFLWLAAPIVAGALVIWLVLPRRSAPSAGEEPAPAAAGEEAAAAAGSSAAPRDLAGARVKEAIDLGKGGGANVGKLIDAYGAWSAEPAAFVARKMVLDALLAQPGLVRVASMRQAVEGSRIPPEEDPLWPQAVDSVSQVWTTATVSAGLDMMLSEQRPRARQLLVSSMTKLALSERVAGLTDQQRSALTSDLIDAKLNASISSREEIEAALLKLGVGGGT